MGEAKRRGTAEERKAQAIEAGRIKRRKPGKKEIEREVMGKLFGMMPMPGHVTPYYIGRR